MKGWTTLAWFALHQKTANAFVSSGRTSTSVNKSFWIRCGGSTSITSHLPHQIHTYHRTMSATATDKSEIDDIDVAENLRLVRESMTQVTDRAVRLVAVSKTVRRCLSPFLSSMLQCSGNN
jgi:hypothetical protein